MAALTATAAKPAPVPRAQMPDFRIARTCYDHLAGKLAIEIAAAMQREKIIKLGEQDFVVTKAGNDWLRNFGIETDALKQRRRAFARKCLDWSERQYHIAGSLGEALLNQMLRRKWLVLKEQRVVGVTVQGRKDLNKMFAIVV